MEAIRKIVTVKNNQINITLPDDFNADEVEVIILPSEKSLKQIGKATLFAHKPEILFPINEIKILSAGI